MTEKNAEHLNQLMEECDALLAQIDLALQQDLAEKLRLQLEIQRQALSNSREGVNERAGDHSEDGGRVSEGIHEAIDDLVKAIKETSRILN